MKNCIVTFILVVGLGVAGSAAAGTNNIWFSVLKDGAWANTLDFYYDGTCSSYDAKYCKEYRLGSVWGSYYHKDVDGISIKLRNSSENWKDAPEWAACKRRGQYCEWGADATMIHGEDGYESTLKEMDFYNDDVVAGRAAIVHYEYNDGTSWERRYNCLPVD